VQIYSMLHIGFDAKRAVKNNTGLGNYSRTAINALSTYYKDNAYYLYAPLSSTNLLPNSITSATNITIRKPKHKWQNTYWRSKGVIPQLLKDNIDIFHGLSHEIPLGIQNTAIKTVVTIHDLIFLKYPEYYPLIDRLLYKSKFQYACQHADVVMATSENTKRDIIQYFNTDARKIEVVYQSCHPLFRMPSNNDHNESVRSQYQLPDNYILSVGTIELRKNLWVVVNALALLPEKFKLVVVGKKTAYLETIQQCITEKKLKDRVIFLENVGLQNLQALYQLAHTFIYPSRYEGFGIPILEALCSGVPVIAAKGSCLEEAGGAHSLYIDPDDYEQLAQYIMLIDGDKAYRNNMIAKGHAYAQLFTEKHFAEQLMKVYKKLNTGA
jgi:glycosyltransferase involved in cell wall biosynthesis